MILYLTFEVNGDGISLDLRRIKWGKHEICQVSVADVWSDVEPGTS